MIITIAILFVIFLFSGLVGYIVSCVAQSMIDGNNDGGRRDVE